MPSCKSLISMATPKGRARVIPANPDAIFLPYQAKWIKDHSRLKLMEKSRQIGLSWSTAYAAAERTAAHGVEGAMARLELHQRCPGDAPPANLGLLTFCVLVLRNGFTVTGESACASPENFNAEIGRQIARENAVEKVRTLMGYELRSKLAAQ